MLYVLDKFLAVQLNGKRMIPTGTGCSTQGRFLHGTPLAISNWKLHNIIETSGGAVVCEEMCTGVGYFERETDETQTTVDGQIEKIRKDINPNRDRYC